MTSVVAYSTLVLGAMGLALGLLLAISSRVFAVKLDPRIEEVTAALAGLNCGVCGYPGCAALAEAIVAGRAKAKQCPPGGASAVRKVAAILGREAVFAEPSVAAVRCRGGKSAAKEKAVYRGIRDCVSAELLGAGPKACVYGCLGMGSCVDVCPFGAIRMDAENLPEVIEGKCTACGMCVAVCPRHIIALIPIPQKVYVGCVSRDRGKRVKDVCAAGCTACGLCAGLKITPSGKVVIKDNLPEFPPDWEDFKTAAGKCPSHCFVMRKA
ncbi:MAG: RnfABCDGE type electron transport complex subunit B [Chlamydiota bacterium]